MTLDEHLTKMTLDGLTELARRLGVDLEDRPESKDAVAFRIVEAVNELRRRYEDARDRRVVPSVAVEHTLVGSAPEIRLEDVRWRIDSKPTKGQNPRARYISYIDARVAAAYLDEWVGPDSWEDHYEEGTLFGHPVLWCHLTIHFPGRSVTRSDVSSFKPGRGGDDTERTATGVKGVVSDALKRAAAKFGVGRNVYELPEVWAECRISNEKAYPTDNAKREITATLRRAGYANVDDVVTDAGADDVVDVEGTPQSPDETPRAVAAAPAETPTNWTAWARRQIYDNVGRDRDLAAEKYRTALDTLGLSLLDAVDGHPDPDEIPNEATARKVVAVATTSAIVDRLPEDLAPPKPGAFGETPQTEYGHEPGDPAPWDPPNGETPNRLISEATAHAANEYVETKSAALRGWVEFDPDSAAFRWSREARRATIVATKGDLAAATEIYTGVLEANDWSEPFDRDTAESYLSVLEAELGAAR